MHVVVSKIKFIIIALHINLNYAFEKKEKCGSDDRNEKLVTETSKPSIHSAPKVNRNKSRTLFDSNVSNDRFIRCLFPGCMSNANYVLRQASERTKGKNDAKSCRAEKKNAKVSLDRQITEHVFAAKLRLPPNQHRNS